MEANSSEIASPTLGSCPSLAMKKPAKVSYGPSGTRTTLDPFGSGTGRWLDATGRTVPRNSERTAKNDYKLDIRLSKTFTTPSRLRFQGIIEAFNVLKTKNMTNYNGIVTASTYLQPASSTNTFYQPRQMQFALRALF